MSTVKLERTSVPLEIRNIANTALLALFQTDTPTTVSDICRTPCIFDYKIKPLLILEKYEIFHIKVIPMEPVDGIKQILVRALNKEGNKPDDGLRLNTEFTDVLNRRFIVSWFFTPDGCVSRIYVTSSEGGKNNNILPLLYELFIQKSMVVGCCRIFSPPMIGTVVKISDLNGPVTVTNNQLHIDLDETHIVAPIFL